MVEKRSSDRQANWKLGTVYVTLILSTVGFTFPNGRFIFTEEANFFGAGGLFNHNRPFVVAVVVVVECLHLNEKQKPWHRGQDLFLYRSLQRRFVVARECMCGIRVRVDTVV